MLIVPAEISLATIRNVPVAKVGPARLWKGGERDFTEEELRDAVRASSDPEIGNARLKLAHEHQLDTGEPSFGTYTDLRYDEKLQTIFANLKGVPLWLAKALPTFYPNRSFEAVENAETKTGSYKLAFKAIGSLGIKMPAIKGLADLQHWASAEMPEGVTLAAAEGTDTPTWGDTAIEPEQGDRETTVNIREKLGLPEDATDEQVAAKLDELAAASSPEALAKVKEQALAEAQAAADAAAAAKIAEAEAKALTTAQEAERKRMADAGMVMVEAAAYEQVKQQASAGATAAKTIDTQRRTALLTRKIDKGAVAPASKDHLLAQLEAGMIDEDTIEKLPDGIIPIDKTALGREDSTDVEAAFGGDGDDWMAGFLRDDEREALGLKGATT